MTSKVTPTDQAAEDKRPVKAAMVGPETASMQSCSGHNLHCAYWRPAGKVRALAFTCHGFGEHVQWYDELAARLTAHGVLAFGHDHVGHGRSEGIRGDVGSISDYVSDVLAHCDIVRKRHPATPLFLVGHSMGGMIGIRAAMARSSALAGLVLVGPLIQPNPREATPFKIAVAKVLSTVTPLMPVTRLNTNDVTRDKDMRKKISKDPLRYHGGVRARWAVACYDELLLLKEGMDDVTWPFLILHGTNDRLCSPGGSELFYKSARSKDKKIKMFPDAYHHLYLEPLDVRLEALSDTVSWITERIPADDFVADGQKICQ